jgi:hypothetical protein
MSTPLVYGGALLALASGPATGIAYGAAFGLGRSLTTWGGAIFADRWSPGAVADALTTDTVAGRWLGGVGAGAILVVAVLSLS